MKLTRRYHFSASHRLHSDILSDAENDRLYGKCNNPFGHGHNYRLEVTVSGKLDGSAHTLVPLPVLDRLVREQILDLLDNRNLNLDVPQFAGSVPTTENLILVIASVLEGNWNAYLGDLPVRLHGVHIQETDRNGFEVLLQAPQRISEPHSSAESATINA